MTPFLLKHTQNYMLENQEMEGVANLDHHKTTTMEDGDEADDDSLIEQHQDAPMSAKVANEMKNAAEMGIIEEKYAPKEITDADVSASTDGNQDENKNIEKGKTAEKPASTNEGGANDDANLVQAKEIV